MSGIEWVMILFLGVPIVFLCGVFVVLACKMQKEEDAHHHASAKREAASC